MSDYRYVPKSEYSVARDNLIDLIHRVQKDVREYFTFSYEFIGSVARNMVTRDFSSNIGYDFDINIRVNDDEEKYSAKDIKTILQNAFNKFVRNYGYDYPEDSTRVLTIKVKDTQHAKILHSADFAVVYDCSDGKQQFIHFNKNQNTYTWDYQPQSYYELPEKIKRIKDNKLWENVRTLYLYKKNNNPMKKKSRALFAETINDIYQKYFN